MKKVFYTVPSRLVGHRLRVRLYDDRLDVLAGGILLMTLVRGRADSSGNHGYPQGRLQPLRVILPASGRLDGVVAALPRRHRNVPG